MPPGIGVADGGNGYEVCHCLPRCTGGESEGEDGVVIADCSHYGEWSGRKEAELVRSGWSDQAQYNAS